MDKNEREENAKKIIDEILSEIQGFENGKFSDESNVNSESKAFPVFSAKNEANAFSFDEHKQNEEIIDSLVNMKPESDDRRTTILSDSSPRFENPIQNGGKNQSSDTPILSPDQLEEAIRNESEEIETQMSEEDVQKIFDEILNNRSAEDIVNQRKEEKKSTVIDLPDGYVNDYEVLFESKPKVDNISDALLMCLEDLGQVDIEYISASTGVTLREVISFLSEKQAIYQNPKTWNRVFYKGWETADEYLSGNLFEKLKKAKEEAKEFPEFFDKNILAIQNLFPDKVLGDEIYATIGTPWIPQRYYNEFISNYLHIKKISNGVTFDNYYKKWKVAYSQREIISRYDVNGMTAVEIFERTLNNRTIKINDKKLINGKEVWILNKGRTFAAMERQKEMIASFRKWIFQDERRKQNLEDIYFEKYGSITARKFDGSFLNLKGMNPEVRLHPHQRSAIARIILTNSCLLSHSVGTGKTYIMISAGMEMRRVGSSMKNMYVVPNAIIEQWRNDFYYLYPNANVLVVDHRNMTPAKKDDTLAKMRDGDYDAIIIAYSSFKMIPVSLNFQIKEVESRIKELEGMNNGRRYLIKKLNDKLAVLHEALRIEKASGKKNVFFDDLKINSLFVDEAHNFKNITIASECDTLGLSRVASAQADDMHMKIKLMRHQRAKSIVFATGTPITNSITDLFVMQTYLQPGQLKFLGIDAFDQWALTFGEKTEIFEMDIDSANFRVVERFNQFHNLPELAKLFSSVADFHVEEDDTLFWNVIRKTIVVPRSHEQVLYLKTIADRTEKLRTQGLPTDKSDNLLKVTNDGRRMALDIRLVDPKIIPTQKTKIDACAEEVFRIYLNEPDVTQLVFCDISTPSGRFNVYDELANKLTALGIPRFEIAFIHDGGNNASKRQVIVDDLNDGKFKILIGSTPMLGTGVNVQKLLFAVHHLDVPWRPSDMVQREGRMIRQGNTNNVVEIYRYVTEGSFDSYSWQLLECKQRFISQLLSSSLDKRDGDEVDSTVLEYAEIKALAIGDARIKERVETYNELSRMKLLKAHNITRRNFVETNLQGYKKDLESAIENQKRLEKDLKTYNRHKQEHMPLKELGELLRKECEKEISRETPVKVADYAGFEIIVPPVSTPENPMFYLVGQTEKVFRFYNQSGTKMNDLEVAKQIERYLSSIPDIIKNINKNKIKLNRDIEQAQLELDTDDNLDQKIFDLSVHLEILDEQLGVHE